ncbi:MAG TPA: hypothetical protein VET88_01505 [Gammaproteobacteria bacterium]|nr:hypothetical protein [Gammaproteobacteria bacterium]
MMKHAILGSLLISTFALGDASGYAMAQDTASPAVEAEAPPAGTESGFDALLGLWVRPDGGYLIAIQDVDTDGRLDATYANPHHLPFAKAEASREDNTIRVFLELRAGGYNGSTYNLTYEPENDVLRGVYYQAVAQQRFDVYFERAR